MKKIITTALIVLVSFLISGGIANASPVSWDGNFSTKVLQPLTSFSGSVVKVHSLTATSTTATSTFAGPVSVGGLVSEALVSIYKATGAYPTLELSNGGSGDVLSILKSGTGNSFTVDSNEFLIANNGRVGMGTSTPGSILSIGNTGANTINIVNNATSTFGKGINLNTGCFSIGDVCIGGGGGVSGTVGSGTTGQVPYYAGAGTDLTATSSLFISTAGNIGIGTASPTSNLHILEDAGTADILLRAPAFNNADIMLQPDGGGTTDQWTIATDANIVFSIKNNVNSMMTILGTQLGGTGYVGIGSTTPGTSLAIGSSTNSINLSTYATSTFADGVNLRSGCFSINDVCVGGGTGGGTIDGTGITGMMTAWLDSDTLIATSTIVGQTVIATSTTATSTLPLLATTAISIAGEYISNFTNYVRSLFTGGRSITITNGTIDADAELYTHSSTYNYASSTLALSTYPVLAKKFPQAATISTISCQNIGSGTSTVMFEERTSLNTAGTDVLYSAGLSAGGDLELASSTLSNNSMASGSWLVMLIDAVTGTPSNPVCDVKYTYND